MYHLVSKKVQNMVMDGGYTKLKERNFYMRGHLGQFIIVIPEDDLIIVRLGHFERTSN